MHLCLYSTLFFWKETPRFVINLYVFYVLIILKSNPSQYQKDPSHPGQNPEGGEESGRPVPLLPTS